MTYHLSFNARALLAWYFLYVCSATSRPVDVCIVLDTMNDAQWRHTARYLFSFKERLDSRATDAMIFLRLDHNIIVDITFMDPGSVMTLSKDHSTSESSDSNEATLDLISLQNVCFIANKGERPDAPNILMLITSGAPTIPNLKGAAKELRESGISILTIGLGDYVDLDELLEISATPDNVFHEIAYSELLQITNVVVDRVWEVVDGTRSTQSTAVSTTLSPDTDLFPILTRAPVLTNHIVSGSCFNFKCRIHYNTNRQDARFRITYLVDGEDVMFYTEILKPPAAVSRMRHFQRNGFLNKYLSCSVQSSWDGGRILSEPRVSNNYLIRNKDDRCVIDGQCYENGTTSSGCKVCDPSRSSTQWSKLELDDNYFGEWTDGSCSKSCDFGQRNRTRDCLIQCCDHRASKDTALCNAFNCDEVSRQTPFGIIISLKGLTMLELVRYEDILVEEAADILNEYITSHTEDFCAMYNHSTKRRSGNFKCVKVKVAKGYPKKVGEKFQHTSLLATVRSSAIHDTCRMPTKRDISGRTQYVNTNFAIDVWMNNLQDRLNRRWNAEVIIQFITRSVEDPPRVTTSRHATGIAVFTTVTAFIIVIVTATAIYLRRKCKKKLRGTGPGVVRPDAVDPDDTSWKDEAPPAYDDLPPSYDDYMGVANPVYGIIQ